LSIIGKKKNYFKKNMVREPTKVSLVSAQRKKWDRFFNIQRRAKKGHRTEECALNSGGKGEKRLAQPGSSASTGGKGEIIPKAL